MSAVKNDVQENIKRTVEPQPLKRRANALQAAPNMAAPSFVAPNDTNKDVKESIESIESIAGWTKCKQYIDELYDYDDLTHQEGNQREENSLATSKVIAGDTGTSAVKATEDAAGAAAGTTAAKNGLEDANKKEGGSSNEPATKKQKLSH